MVASMREKAAISPAVNAALTAARSRTRNWMAASRALRDTSGGSVPKRLRKASGSVTLISPRGVDAVMPLDVTERSRAPAKAVRNA